jgi:hypothetical protein
MKLIVTFLFSRSIFIQFDNALLNFGSVIYMFPMTFF